jgi:signal transduction histidine kinase
MYTTLWETIREGREWRGEFRNRKKNGELYWEAAAISPITAPDGSISHFLAIKENITERLALAGELRQAQKLEVIGQMAAGIAHEINTPIQFVADNLTFLEDACSSIFGLLESCRPGEGKSLSEAEAARARAEADCDLEFLRAEVPQAIEQSLEGTRRVATIVRAMKEFSHPDVAEKTYCDLNQGIASTLTIARSEWKDVAEMASDFDETLPPVLCHPGEINQVVLNLIVNAAHAIRERPEKAEKGQITVRTRRRGEFAEIAVSDTGHGIPADIQGRIFEPFFTTREVGSGTGQGLALAHSVVVRKHEGKIWFETEVGRGTTFFIHLPIEPGRGRGGK